MATENPRITFTLSEEMRKRIDEYRFDNRIRNQTQAIVALINIGLKELCANTTEQKPYISKEEEKVLSAYRAADPLYQNFALEILESHKVKEKENRA